MKGVSGGIAKKLRMVEAEEAVPLLLPAEPRPAWRSCRGNKAEEQGGKEEERCATQQRECATHSIGAQQCCQLLLLLLKTRAGRLAWQMTSHTAPAAAKTHFTSHLRVKLVAVVVHVARRCSPYRNLDVLVAVFRIQPGGGCSSPSTSQVAPPDAAAAQQAGSQRHRNGHSNGNRQRAR